LTLKNSKIESFIRSKYESRRWALDGTPPIDPSVLDNGAPSAPQQEATLPPRPTHAQSTSISTRPSPSTTRQPQAHQLLSSNYTNRSSATPNSPAIQLQAAPPPPVQQTPVNDLFTLDFHAPPTSVNPPAQEQKKDVKQDILSLFSTPPSTSAPQFGQMGNQAAYWGGAALPPQQQQQQTTSMMGMNGIGMWGATSGWAAPVIPAQANVWSSPSVTAPQQQQQSNLFESTAAWGTTPTPTSAIPDLFTTPTPAVQKKDDVFGDIWGGYK
jgi:stromal membrane-associated protein